MRLEIFTAPKPVEPEPLRLKMRYTNDAQRNIAIVTVDAEGKEINAIAFICADPGNSALRISRPTSSLAEPRVIFGS